MTQHILHISSSPFPATSITRLLGQDLLKGLRDKFPSVQVTERDLTAAPLPHMEATRFGALMTPADQRSAEQSVIAAEIEQTIDEIFAADTIIIEAPMWNFGIPSVLKAWIDHISQAGRTFKYSESGPVGLVPAGKKAIIVSSRGGVYSDGPAASMDHQESYLASVLGFLGIKDISFVRAEGVNLGADAAANAKASAHEQIKTLLTLAA